MEALLSAQALTKVYGRRPVVRDVNLAIRPGEVYALAGPNGSGKTTLIRLLTGLAFPTAGTVYYLGKPLQHEPKLRRALGALVEAPAAFYPHLSGRENLEMQAWIFQLAQATQRIQEALERLELLAIADLPTRSYSLGQRQRLGLAAALLHRPQLLILDEPTSGLDPQGILLVHRILVEEAQRGAGVLLSTHHLQEISEYAQRVGILSEGSLIEEIELKSWPQHYRLQSSDPEKAVALLRTLPHIQRALLQGEEILFEGELDEAMRALVQEGFRIHALSPERFSLYTYYRERVFHA